MMLNGRSSNCYCQWLTLEVALAQSRAIFNIILYFLRLDVLGVCCLTISLNGKPYHYFRQWRNEGIWQQVHERLRQWVRTIEANRPASPSAGVVDRQSVKSGTMVSKEVGYNGGKPVRGPKRYVLVDTLGLFVAAVATAASVLEGAGLEKTLTSSQRTASQSPTPYCSLR